MGSRTIVVLQVALLLAPAAADSEALGKASTLRCAIQEATECHPADGCRRTTTGILDLPDFIEIDLGERLMRGTTPSGREASTEIEKIEEVGNLVTALGVERYAWSAMLSRETGHLTLSAVDDDVGFVVFGVCQAQ